MEHNDLQRSEGLNRFWDDQALGRAPVDPVGIDSDVAGLIERLQALGDPPVHDSARDRVWRDLQQHPQRKEQIMETRALSLNEAQSLPLTTLAAGSHSGPRAESRRDWWRPQRRAWSQLATAALLLLTLVTSVIAFGRLRGGAGDQPASLPAMVATPTQLASTDTLFSAVLPAGEIPIVEPTDLFIWNMRIDPGVRESVDPSMQTSNRGPQITHVVTGALTLTVDGPVRLYRGAKTAAAEEIPPGTVLSLQAGETTVYAFERPTEFANLGSSPAQVVSGGYWSGTVSGPVFHDPGITFIDFTDVYPNTPLPAVPVQATLSQETLPSHGSTAVPPPGSLVIQVGADADVSVGENSDGSLRNVSPRQATIFVLTLTPLAADMSGSAPNATPQTP